MARSRTKAVELAKLLNSADRPIYVLDDEQTLVFCNSACLEWLGRTAEELEGRRCKYHSSPEVTGIDAVAAGLCPPPAVLAGRELVATIACIAADDRLRRRRARFIPLGDPKDVIGLVGLVDSQDLPDSDLPPQAPGPDQPETVWLHEQVRAFRQRMTARFHVDRLVGDSPAMRRVRTQVVLAATSGASTFIVGPPGSGRQHVARAIHYGAGSESAVALVPLACAVLGDELIRSTVAALASGDPRPDRAGHGTLLLNDVDQLPIEVQGELAEVLGDPSFPLRLTATATEPLGQLARRGKYRADLASVLGTIVIELPPLAGRREDLPMLAQVLLEEINARSEKQLAGFSPEALDRLDAYSWPGNIDELARFVAEAHRRAEAAEIGVGDLPKKIHLAADAAAHPPRVEETIVLDEFLGRIERELIQRALARAKGNKSKAAKLLGLTRPRLYRRLEQLGLEEPGEQLAPGAHTGGSSEQ